KFLSHDSRCLDVSSFLDTHRKTNKLRHGPRQRCRRSSTSANLEPWTISIPNLFRNHQPIVREPRQRIQTSSRARQVAGSNFILTTLAGQQRPKTSDAIAPVVSATIRSLTVGIMIVAIPRRAEGCFNFY